MAGKWPLTKIFHQLLFDPQIIYLQNLKSNQIHSHSSTSEGSNLRKQIYFPVKELLQKMMRKWCYEDEDFIAWKALWADIGVFWQWLN